MWDTNGITTQPTRTEADDPVYKLSFGYSVDSFLCPKMKVSWVQDSVQRFGIIAKVDESDIYVLTICNSVLDVHDVLNTSTYAISDFKYSSDGVAFGFPYDLEKWTIETISKVNLTVNNPNQNQVYNPGSLKLDLPIGNWILGYSLLGLVDSGSTNASQVAAKFGLSTLSTSMGDASFATRIRMGGPSSTSKYLEGNLVKYNILTVNQKTSHYLVTNTPLSGMATINFRGDVTDTIIRATSAYL